MINVLLPNGITFTLGDFHRVHEEYKQVGGKTKRFVYVAKPEDSLDDLNCLQGFLGSGELRIGNLTTEQMKEILTLAFDKERVDLMNPKLSFAVEMCTKKSQLKDMKEPYVYYRHFENTNFFNNGCNIFGDGRGNECQEIDFDEDEDDGEELED